MAHRTDVRADDPLLAVAEVGDSFETDERLIRRLIAQRPITYVHSSGSTRLQRRASDAFIDAGRITNEQ
ncbi:excisionase family DNA-binding protein [Geodermatophilus sp. URMC 64]